MSRSTLRRAASEIADSCLAMRTRRLSRQITRLYDDALRPFGLTAGQLNLLVGVALLGPVRSVDLGSHFEMEKSTLSRNLRPMLDAGWLESERAGGNAKTLQLTELGGQLLEEARPAWRSAQASAAQLLGQGLEAQLLAIPG